MAIARVIFSIQQNQGNIMNHAKMLEMEASAIANLTTELSRLKAQLSTVEI